MSDLLTHSAETGPKQYRHSGRFSRLGLVVCALASMVAGAFIAAGYAYVDANCPFVYLNLILCFMFGILIARFNAGFARAFKCRNVAMLTATTAASAVFSYYIAWASWVNAIIARNPKAIAPGIWTLASQPVEMWEWIVAINENGAWTLSKDPIAGTMLWGIWICEFAVFMGSAIWYIRSMDKTPFCEACENWCTRYPLSLKIRVLPGMDEGDLIKRLQAGEFELLQSAGWPNAGDAMLYAVSLEHCKQCGGTNVLTLDRFSIETQKGKSVQKKTTLINQLPLSREDVVKIRDIFTQMLLEKGVEAPEFGPLAIGASM